MTNLDYAPTLLDNNAIETSPAEARDLSRVVFMEATTPDKPLLLERIGRAAETIGSVVLAGVNVAFFGKH